MRLIDADALRAQMAGMIDNCDSCLVSVGDVERRHLSCNECYLDAVDNAPTLKLEPVRHGYWRGEADGYVDGELIFDTWYCSECDYCIDKGIDDVELLPNYCPYCGAKMDCEE